MKIITLTLNPAFDIHCRAENFTPYNENIVEISSRDAGGKGINISRALAAASRESRAIVLAGDENARELLQMLSDELFTVSAVNVPGRIRENITIHEGGKPETRISFGGFSADKSVLTAIKESLGDIDAQTVITFTGSMPIGLEARLVLELLHEAREKGAKVVIDSRSVTLDEILAFKPWLIKPNKNEIEKYVGREIKTPEDALRVAEKICADGVENVMISLGGEGAVLCYRGKSYYARVPAVGVISTIGAGDSTIAGFIDAYCDGKPVCECLRRAVSFGTAACMREGTQSPLLDDIERIECDIKIDCISLSGT